MSTIQWFHEYEVYQDGRIWRVLKTNDFPEHKVPPDWRYVGMVPTDAMFRRDDDGKTTHTKEMLT